MTPVRTPVVAGNWKMYKGPAATREFFQRFLDLAKPREDATVIIFPPALSLPAAAEAARGRPDLRLGVQNIYWEREGAYTGEVSAPMAREAGARFALVGHSERRHIFGESNEATRRKVAAALDAGLTPVLCVGETLDERRAGQVEDVIVAQLDAAFDGLAPEVAARILIAYEPVWAIGTGVNATPEDAAEAHGMLRRRLGELIGAAYARTLPILYGGSVKPDNAARLLAADDVDGVLVGGASLDPASFAAILEAAAGYP
jgi:triosephosphate isomerase